MTKSEAADAQARCEELRSGDWQKMASAELQLKISDVLPAALTDRAALIEVGNSILREVTKFDPGWSPTLLRLEDLLRSMGELE